MKVLILAGEQSGDLYGAELVEELRNALPDKIIEFRGTGGEAMLKAGVKLEARAEDMAVMGIIPVLTKILFFWKLAKKLKNIIKSWQPDLVLTVDYPGLNLRLCAFAKKLGIPTAHVVCPQVWAWKKGRIPKIMNSVDLLLCFFPFEPVLFNPPNDSKFKAVFIGHPLADTFKKERKKEHPFLPWRECSRRVALLPGSRMSEISKNLPLLLATANILEEHFGIGSISFLIPASSKRAQKAINSIISNYDILPINIECLPPGESRNVLLTAEVAAVASGTATLEAALARVPTVLVYKVSAHFALLCRIILKRLKGIGVGLANIVAGKPIMPELLQNDFTPEATADILTVWLSYKEKAIEMSNTLNDTMLTLESGNSNAIKNAINEILNIISKNNS